MQLTLNRTVSPGPALHRSQYPITRFIARFPLLA
jgi:hypothetical protein